MAEFSEDNSRFDMGIYQAVLDENTDVKSDVTIIAEGDIVCDEINSNEDEDESDYIQITSEFLLNCNLNEDSSVLDVNSDLSGKDIPNLEELIELVINQTQCSKSAARTALIEGEGDIIFAILKVTD